MVSVSHFSVLLLVVLATSVVDAAPKLIHAEVLWRHGTRAPDHLYATSLNKATDFPPGLGELVPQGVLDHIKLGAKLGRRYINDTGLVSPIYIANEIKIISTTSDRTIASAQANFAGFYSKRRHLGPRHSLQCQFTL
uniref:acid phosphatase n=1 Tax=Panagrellus redivivus TaxID=6233 RepID=A0A7E4W119_PANRE